MSTSLLLLYCVLTPLGRPEPIFMYVNSLPSVICPRPSVFAVLAAHLSTSSCVRPNCEPRHATQASRLVAHAAEVKEQADAPPATQSGADEFYEVCPDRLYRRTHRATGGYGSNIAGCGL